MNLFGLQTKQIILVPTITIGVGLIGYALYCKFGKSGNEFGVEDLDLPFSLEHEYGDFVATSLRADASAADYLNHLPESFFHLIANLSSFIQLRLQLSKQNPAFGRVLVIGSCTSALPFELSKVFAEVKGIESSFTKVVTSYQLQNGKDIDYFFPLEGNLRTARKTLSRIAERFRNDSRNTSPSESVGIIHANPSVRLSAQIGLFQAVVLFKILTTLEKPEEFLRKVQNYVQSDGFLFIVSDYDWPRSTNNVAGPDTFGVAASFELLKKNLHPHFAVDKDIHMPDVTPISLRSCTIRNYHVTSWRKVAPEMLE